MKKKYDASNLTIFKARNFLVLPYLLLLKYINIYINLFAKKEWIFYCCCCKVC